MPKIVIYSIDYCPYCERAKALLASRSLPFTEIKVDRSDETAVLELFARSGMKTFPQIFFDDELVGGFRELDIKFRSP